MVITIWDFRFNCVHAE